MNIFYLEWTQKRPTICEFRDNIPSQYNFTCSIQLRKVNEGFKTLHLYGLINKDLNNYQFDTSPYSKRSYLVSHLQKSIRKMNSKKSIQSAKHLIDLDINSFLRRLPIIMFEDVVPHTSLPIIIWLMIAVTKKFQIKTVMVQWLLGVVYFLSSHDQHDQVKKIKNIPFDSIRENLFLKSILIRISYGGMKGDMEMLNYFIELWSHRFMNGIQMNHSKIQYINHTIDPLPRSKWDLCANDFHCNKQLIQMVQQQYELFSEEYIQKLIWEHSSRFNKRTKIKRNEDEYKDWRIIKKFVRFKQQNMQYY